MFLPDDVKAIRARYVVRYPVPQGVPGDAHEENCRQWSIRFAEQVRHDTDDSTWGAKRADAGRPISKDTLARNLAPKLYSWDLLSGTGTGSPTLNESPAAEDITGQVFVHVEPVDHLGDPPPPPPPDDTLAKKLAALEARVAELEGRPVPPDLTARVEMLEQRRWRAVGGTGRAYGHAHSISVTLEPA